MTDTSLTWATPWSREARYTYEGHEYLIEVTWEGSLAYPGRPYKARVYTGPMSRGHLLTARGKRSGAAITAAKALIRSRLGTRLVPRSYGRGTPDPIQ